MTAPEIGMEEAAAFWGCAKSPVYSTEERLQLALSALEFFGGEYEKREEVPDDPISKALVEAYRRGYRDRREEKDFDPGHATDLREGL